jgi:hypothetical protein
MSRRPGEPPPPTPLLATRSSTPTDRSRRDCPTAALRPSSSSPAVRRSSPVRRRQEHIHSQLLRTRHDHAAGEDGVGKDSAAKARVTRPRLCNCVSPVHISGSRYSLRLDRMMAELRRTTARTGATWRSVRHAHFGLMAVPAGQCRLAGPSQSEPAASRCGWRPVAARLVQLFVAEGLDLGELGLGQLARGVALGDLRLLDVVPDAVNHLGVGQRSDVADLGEVRH